MRSLILLLLISALALTNLEALQRAQAYTLEGETAVLPKKTVRCQEGSYWVVPLMVGDEYTGFVPFNARTGEVPSSKTLRSQLIQTQYTAIFLSSFKEKASFLSDKTVDQFSSLAYHLEDARTSLGLAAQKEKSLSVYQARACLSSLKEDILEKSGEISDALNAVNDFLESPRCEALVPLREKLERAYDNLSELSAEVSRCAAAIRSLRKKVLDLNLPAEEKSSLLNLIKLPFSEPDLVGLFSQGSTEYSSLKSGLSKISSESVGMTDSLETRVEKKEYYDIYYEKVSVGSFSFSSLGEMYDFLIKWGDLWKRGESLPKAKEYYSRMKNAEKAGDFGQAKHYAELFRNKALDIIKGGFKEEKGFDWTSLLPYLFLAIVLIVLWSLRGKISEMLGGGEESEEDYY